MNTIHHTLGLAIVLVLTSACSRTTNFPAPAPCQQARIGSIPMDAVGPQGFTGDELLAAAEDRVSTFEVEWDPAKNLSPADDQFTVTFLGDAVASEWYSVCDDQSTSAPYLQIEVPVEVTNHDSTLTLVFDLLANSPDLATHGAYVYGGASTSHPDTEIEVSGLYLTRLSEDNPDGAMWGGFGANLGISGDTADSVATYDGPLVRQTFALGHRFERPEADGAGLLYTCASDAPCVLPSTD